MRGRYFDLRWFTRVARVVPVIAGAALIGGMVGGFAMFAIDSALTWHSSPRVRSDARAENETPVLNPQQQQMKSIRIVGGAIPDPSAGMSAPPPVQKLQRSADPTQPAQISSALFAPKPLGPASELRLQTATTTASSATAGSAVQPQSPSANQLPVPAQNAAPTGASAQPQTRWPDALSRAHQHAANAQQQAAPAAVPAANAQTTDRAVSAADYQGYDDRADGSRHGRHSRRHAWRYGGDDNASRAASRGQQARSYDRLYDSYGNRRDRSYRNTRQQFYRDRDDQSGAAPPPEAARSRPEPFWGGGAYRRGYGDDD